MSRIYSPEQFVEMLGPAQSARGEGPVEGLARPSGQPGVFLFCSYLGDGNWIRVPSTLLERVEYLDARNEGHHVRLFPKPRTDANTAELDALLGAADRDFEEHRCDPTMEVSDHDEHAPERAFALAAAPARELSGATWVGRFPTSRSIADLVQPFSDNMSRFVAALQSAGATVKIAATLRPARLAYLMHYAWRIVKENLDVTLIPAIDGVAIEWVHRTAAGAVDVAASKAAAEAMVKGFGIVFKPALRSRHIEGRAIDMRVTWSGDLMIRTGTGETVTITSQPRSGDNVGLHGVGATYKVVKLVSDPPHWSDDGR